MNGTFSFAFVQSRNLGRESFPVAQAEIEFAITGPDDPLTLQRMRDEVDDAFKKTQKQVNDFIDSRTGEIERLGVDERRRKQEELLRAGNATIARFLADFEKVAGDTLAAFLTKEKARQPATGTGS